MELSRKAVSDAEAAKVAQEPEDLGIRVTDETEILISGGSVERTCVQDRRFAVTALCSDGGEEHEAAKMKASLIDFGRFDEDPWPLIDGCGDAAAELCELLYDRYKKAGEPDKIREPILFIEEAEGKADAKKFLFSNLPYAVKKLYGHRVTAIGAKAEQVQSAITDDFVEEFRDEQYGYALYRLDGNVAFRKSVN